MSYQPVRQKRLEKEIKKGKWVKKDEWWFKPPDKDEQSPDFPWLQNDAWPVKKWMRNLAHECEPGIYRAPTFQFRKGKFKKAIYCYCSNCKAKLPDSIKTIIFFKEDL